MIYLPFLLVIPIVLSLLLRLVSHLQTWAYFHRAAQQSWPSWQPGVSFIVPVRGLDQDSEQNFQSLCEQDYPHPYEIIFALETEADPAVPAIRELIQRYPQRAIQLVFSEPLGLAAVGKIKNLIAGYRTSRYEVIVLIDSDVHIAPDFLSRSVGYLADSHIGAAFAAPVCEGSQDWVAALHNMAVNASALNYAAAAYQDRNNSVVGSLIVTRRDVLEAIGGLDAIANKVVGIDVSLGQAIHKANYQIRLLDRPARIYHSRDTFPAFWWQMHRWLVTIRHYFPQFPWLMIFLAVPLWWAFLFLAIALLLQIHIGFGAVLLAIVLLADLLSAAVINRRLVKDKAFWPFLWVALLGEIVSLPVLLHSLFSNKVLWRGRWLAVSEAP